MGWLHRIVEAFACDADQTVRDIVVLDGAERDLLVEDWSRKAVPPAGLPQTEGADRVYVLDEWRQPVAIGVTGDVYYAGGAVGRAAGAARGPAAQRFAPSPFGDGQLYRTGDRGRWTTDGRLEPITTGEPRLQAALEALDGVAVAATRHWDLRGVKTLAGYLVAEPGVADTEALLDSARAALPEEFAGAVLAAVDDIAPPP